MITYAFALSILMHFELVKCHSISEILPNLIGEFRFNKVITIEDKMGMKEITNVVKNLNYQGYFIDFSQKQTKKYH